MLLKNKIIILQKEKTYKYSIVHIIHKIRHGGPQHTPALSHL